MSITHYKDLIVWQKSVDLVHELYKITKLLPKIETYGLISQMQRSAASISSNIAEGQARNHKAEFIQFLGIAFASSAELETQIIISKREYPHFEYKQVESLLIEVQKMLTVLMRKLSSH